MIMNYQMKTSIEQNRYIYLDIFLVQHWRAQVQLTWREDGRECASTSVLAARAELDRYRGKDQRREIGSEYVI